MRYLNVTLVALNLPDLRAAEAYYCRLLDLDVAWRDTDGPTSMFAAWEEIDAEGANPISIMLECDRFRLSLTRLGAEEAARAGRGIVYAAVQVSVEQLGKLRDRVQAAGLEVVRSGAGEPFIFRDGYDVEWQLDSRTDR